MSVAFDEFSDSPTYRFGFSGHSATRHGLIPWGSIKTLVAELFPVSFAADTSGFSGIGKAFPSPFGAALRVDSLEVRPFTDRIIGPGDGSGGVDLTTDFDSLVQYEYADCVVTYTTPRFPDLDEQDPVELLDHKWSAGGEFLTLPSSELQWNDGPTAVSSDITPGRLVPTINHTITWPRVKKPPFAAIRAAIGTVNNAAFSMRTGVAAAETLLFTGAELGQTIMSDGARAWNVTYHVSEKRTEAEDNSGIGTWNHFWRNESSKVGFYRMETSSSEKIYRTSNFDTLFQTG